MSEEDFLQHLEVAHPSDPVSHPLRPADIEIELLPEPSTASGVTEELLAKHDSMHEQEKPSSRATLPVMTESELSFANTISSMPIEEIRERRLRRSRNPDEVVEQQGYASDISSMPIDINLTQIERDESQYLTGTTIADTQHDALEEQEDSPPETSGTNRRADGTEARKLIKSAVEYAQTPDPSDSDFDDGSFYDSLDYNRRRRRAERALARQARLGGNRVEFS